MNQRDANRQACAKVQTVKGEAVDPHPTKKKPNRLPGLSIREGLTLHPFDAEHGVRTSGLIAGRHLKNGHRHDRYNTAYFGVAPSVFRSLIRRWRRSAPAAKIENTTFLDLGAGMGRAVLLASEIGFKAVWGVELHPKLAAIAKRNIGVWRAAGREHAPIRIVQGDAVELVLPPGPLVAFLFNPFEAPVLRRLLKAWREQYLRQPRPIDLLYINHEQESVLESTRGWRKMYAGKVRRSVEDAIADHRIMANQPEREYAASNSEDCSIWCYSG